MVHGASPDGSAPAPDLRQELPWLSQQQTLCASLGQGSMEELIVQTAQTIQLYRPLPGHAHWILALHVARGHAPLAGVRLLLEAEAHALDQALQAGGEQPATVF